MNANSLSLGSDSELVRPAALQEGEERGASVYVPHGWESMAEAGEEDPLSVCERGGSKGTSDKA